MEGSDITGTETDIEDNKLDSDDDWNKNQVTDDYSDEDDDCSEYSTVSGENDDYSERSTVSIGEDFLSDYDDSDDQDVDHDREDGTKNKHEILRQNVIILGSKPNDEISTFFKSLFSSEYSLNNKEQNKRGCKDIDSLDRCKVYKDLDDDEGVNAAKQVENNISFTSYEEFDLMKSKTVNEQAVKTHYFNKTASNKLITNTDQNELSDTIRTVCLHCEKIFKDKQALIDHLIAVAKDKHLLEKQESINETKEVEQVNDKIRESNANETQVNKTTRQDATNRTKKINKPYKSKSEMLCDRCGFQYNEINEELHMTNLCERSNVIRIVNECVSIKKEDGEITTKVEFTDKPDENVNFDQHVNIKSRDFIVFEDDDSVTLSSRNISEKLMNTYRRTNCYTNKGSIPKLDYVKSEFVVTCEKPSKRLKFE